jgi:hypothetical protein
VGGEGVGQQRREPLPAREFNVAVRLNDFMEAWHPSGIHAPAIPEFGPPCRSGSGVQGNQDRDV